LKERHNKIYCIINIRNLKIFYVHKFSILKNNIKENKKALEKTEIYPKKKRQNNHNKNLNTSNTHTRFKQRQSRIHDRWNKNNAIKSIINSTCFNFAICWSWEKKEERIYLLLPRKRKQENK
jgi:hypothetical protein